MAQKLFQLFAFTLMFCDKTITSGKETVLRLLRANLNGEDRDVEHFPIYRFPIIVLVSNLTGDSTCTHFYPRIIILLDSAEVLSKKKCSLRQVTTL